MFGKVAHYGCLTSLFAAITALLAILFLLPPFGQPLAWWMPVTFAVSMLLLIGATRSYFQAGASIAELEAQGLVETHDYRVIRAFGVEEWGDEGWHYFLELESKFVLYLRWPEFYNYNPIEDDPELNQPRLFPCSEFTLRKHKTKGYLIDIICKGDVIEPEVIIPITHRADFLSLIDLDEHLIIRDHSYDQIKAERLARS